MTEQKSKSWLVLNAIACWLSYFPQHKWVKQYEELKKEYQEAVIKENALEVEEAKQEQIQKPQGRRTAAKAANKNT